MIWANRVTDCWRLKWLVSTRSLGTRKHIVRTCERPIEKADARHKRDLFGIALRIALKTSNDFRNDDRGSRPFTQRMLTPAIEALRVRILRRAVWTNGPRFEGVEGLPALAAPPIRPQRRRRLAGWAGVSVARWQLRKAQQCLRVLESGPAIHKDEDGNSAQPRISFIECKHDETRRSGPGLPRSSGSRPFRIRTTKVSAESGRRRADKSGGC
jgi:hypothetical protein